LLFNSTFIKKDLSPARSAEIVAKSGDFFYWQNSMWQLGLIRDRRLFR